MGIYASTQFYTKDFNLSGVWKTQGVPEPNPEHNIKDDWILSVPIHILIET
jgi:hypothetical protein